MEMNLLLESNLHDNSINAVADIYMGKYDALFEEFNQILSEFQNISTQ
jgi:hypothetical protein